LQGQAPEVQRRREGDTLYIKCSYATRTEYENTKYWCLTLGNGGCQGLVNTYRKQSQDGGIQINDDTATKTVSVTMTGLKAEDSGTYFCAIYKYYNEYPRLRTISLIVFRGEYLYPTQSQILSGSNITPSPPLSPSPPQLNTFPCCSGNTFLILSVVLLILLLLALLICTALAVRYYRLLLRTGIREAEDTSDRAEGTAQPGSTGRRESSQDDSKGPTYINLDVQSPSSLEDPLYCNVELSQAPRNPQHVEYAIIAFNQSPGTSRE
ncbi:CLM7 protein, partial [Rhodinocichla rosea]|nr:CLM7 protein [Rhodinocichla rosea]